MIAARFDKVSYTYIAEPVIGALSWEVHDDRVAGLVGPNGSGKSTMLRILAGQLKPDSGFVVYASGITVGYLEQEPRLDPTLTVWQEAMTASPELRDVEARLHAVEASLGQPEVYGIEHLLQRALSQQERLLEEYERLGGASFEGRVRGTLFELGFTERDLSLSTTVLSGGQKKLLGLAKLVVRRPSLLLLDEPDNHLDLDGKRRLERFIRGYKGGVVVVSHDRYMLDIVADEIIELDRHLERYPGNYTEFVVEKAHRQARQQVMYRAQQKEISRLDEAAKRFELWARQYDSEKFARRARNMRKRIDRIDRIERPNIDPRQMNLRLDGWRGSTKVIELEGVAKAFPTADGVNQVLKDLDLLVWHGERIGLVGPNGAGKSVLFRILLGEIEPTAGSIYMGPSIQPGYYAQEHQTLDYDLTLLETMAKKLNLPEGPAMGHLTKFLFTREQAISQVRTLSGGERSRLQMSLLMRSGANLLLLDEPTNNLDIPSAEVLEDALSDFKGTIIVISHDRYFLDRVVTRVIELDAGRLESHAGNFTDYVAGRARRG